MGTLIKWQRAHLPSFNIESNLLTFLDSLFFVFFLIFSSLVSIVYSLYTWASPHFFSSMNFFSYRLKKKLFGGGKFWVMVFLSLCVLCLVHEKMWVLNLWFGWYVVLFCSVFFPTFSYLKWICSEIWSSLKWMGSEIWGWYFGLEWKGGSVACWLWWSVLVWWIFKKRVERVY